MAPGEVPIVAHQGEVIGCPDQMARAFGGAGNRPTNIVVNDQRTMTASETGRPPISVNQGLGPDGERQVEIMVHDSLSRMMESGKAHPLFANAYGVRPIGAG